MTILITGATSGIGLSLAKNIPNKKTTTLILLGRDATKLKRLKNLLMKQNYLEIRTICHDLSMSFSNTILEQIQKVDVIINSAAEFGLTQKFTDFLEHQFFVNFDVNVVKPIVLIKNSMDWMIKNNFGIIINIGSNAGLVGYSLRLPYCMSKHALLAFTKTLNSEIKSGIYGKNLNIKAYYLALPPVNNKRLKEQIKARAKYKSITFKKMSDSFKTINKGDFLSEESVVEIIVNLFKNKIINNDIVKV